MEEEKLSPEELEREAVLPVLEKLAESYINHGGIGGILDRRRIHRAIEDFEQGRPEKATEIVTREANFWQSVAGINTRFASGTSLPVDNSFAQKAADLFGEVETYLVLTMINRIVKTDSNPGSLRAKELMQIAVEVLLTRDPKAIPQPNQTERLLKRILEDRQALWPEVKT